MVQPAGDLVRPLRRCPLIASQPDGVWARQSDALLTTGHRQQIR